MHQKHFKSLLFKNGIRTQQMDLEYGVIGLQSLSVGHLTECQLRAVRNVLRKRVKKTGVVYDRVKPMYGITKKPQQVRMGKGKGGLSHAICRVLRYEILFEIQVPYPSVYAIIDSLRAAALRLPVRTQIITSFLPSGFASFFPSELLTLNTIPLK